MPDNDNQSFGVFKPVGHVVISFPDAASADAAAAALATAGVHGPEQLRRYSDTQMLRQIERDMQQASPLASIGQEMNLVKAHRERAERGYHFLVVRAANDDAAASITSLARRFGAESAQHYGTFIIDELIEPRGHQAQVAESPDRGLDVPLPR